MSLVLQLQEVVLPKSILMHTQVMIFRVLNMKNQHAVICKLLLRTHLPMAPLQSANVMIF